jgi:hypothetical protein
MRFESPTDTPNTAALPGVTEQHHRSAILALPDSVVLGKLLPVPFLIRREYAQSLAERTEVIQGAQDCGADELRAIGHPLQQLG